jgi:hypothetical protein
MINLPSNWNSITLRQYQELEELKLDGLVNIELLLERIAILLDTDIYDDRISNMDFDEVLNIKETLYWLDTEPKTNISDIDFLLKPKKLNKLLLGEFIDIEHYINDPIKNLHIISSIYFKNNKLDEWNNKIEEPYIYDIEERSELFLELPITYIMKYFNLYMSWRNEFLKNYEELFQTEEPDIEEVDLQGYELIQYQKEVMEEKVKSKWSWESILYGLSSGDLTKFKNLFDVEVILVFNMLSMRKTLNIE